MISYYSLPEGEGYTGLPNIPQVPRDFPTVPIAGLKYVYLNRDLPEGVFYLRSGIHLDRLGRIVVASINPDGYPYRVQERHAIQGFNIVDFFWQEISYDSLLVRGAIRAIEEYHPILMSQREAAPPLRWGSPTISILPLATPTYWSGGASQGVVFNIDRVPNEGAPVRVEPAPKPEPKIIRLGRKIHE